MNFDSLLTGILPLEIAWSDLSLGPLIHELLQRAVRVVLIVALAWSAIRLTSRLVETMRRQWVSARDALAAHSRYGYTALLTSRKEEFHRRSRTVARVIREAIRVSIIAIAATVIAEQLGFNTTAILGAIALTSLTVGMAARSLVKDAVTGFFLLADGHLRVGDSVAIGKISGSVEDISLRRVKLRSGDGAVHIVPNGSIGSFANRNIHFSCYVWNLGLSYEADVDKAVGIVVEIGKAARLDPVLAEHILDDLEVLGVDNLGDYAVVVKVRIRTKPGKESAVGRAINRRILDAFRERDIPIACPSTTWYVGSRRSSSTAPLQ
jgi:small-conductance mechanosensitive channel